MLIPDWFATGRLTVRAGTGRSGAGRAGAWAITGTAAEDASDGREREDAAKSSATDAATMAAAMPQRTWREGTGE